MQGAELLDDPDEKLYFFLLAWPTSALLLQACALDQPREMLTGCSSTASQCVLALTLLSVTLSPMALMSFAFFLLLSPFLITLATLLSLNSCFWLLLGLFLFLCCSCKYSSPSPANPRGHLPGLGFAAAVWLQFAVTSASIGVLVSILQANYLKLAAMAITLILIGLQVSWPK